MGDMAVHAAIDLKILLVWSQCSAKANIKSFDLCQRLDLTNVKLSQKERDLALALMMLITGNAKMHAGLPYCLTWIPLQLHGCPRTLIFNERLQEFMRNLAKALSLPCSLAFPVLLLALLCFSFLLPLLVSTALLLLPLAFPTISVLFF